MTERPAAGQAIGDYPQTIERFSIRHIRHVEWLIGLFHIYAPVVALLFPVSPHIRIRILLVSATVFFVYGLLIGLELMTRLRAPGFVRDWLPLALVLVAYWEMGWLAQPHYTFLLEEQWVVLDRIVLRNGGKAVIEAFGSVLPAILEIAYALVHALAPISVGILYGYQRRDRVNRFLFIFVLATLMCYVQFPFWPSEPPRRVFPGEDAPGLDTVFRRFNWWLLDRGGIYTSVFPSGHVAASLSCAIAMIYLLPEKRWVGRALFVMAALIAIATVYGRYHYLVDTLAGIVVALLAFAIFVGVDRFSNRPAPQEARRL